MNPASSAGPLRVVALLLAILLVTACGSAPAAGRRVIHVDRLTSDGSARRIPVELWFPVRQPGGDPHPLRTLLPADVAGDLATTPGGPALLDSVTGVYPASLPEGRLSAVVIANGLNASASLHVPLAGALASAGFVVATVSTGSVVNGTPLPFDAAGMAIQADDLRAVVDSVMRLPFVRPDRVVLAAWSVGGVAALQLARTDGRVAALLSLDSGIGYEYGASALADSILAPSPVREPLRLLHLRGDRAGRFVVPMSDSLLQRVSSTGATVEVDTIAGLAHRHFATSLVLADTSLSPDRVSALLDRAVSFVRQAAR